MQDVTVIAMVEPDFRWDGAQLRRVRLSRRLRLVDLAAQLGISEGYLRHLETGIRRPGLLLVARMEDLFKLPAEQLGATGLPPRPTTTEGTP